MLRQRYPSKSRTLATREDKEEATIRDPPPSTTSMKRPGKSANAKNARDDFSGAHEKGAPTLPRIEDQYMGGLDIADQPRSYYDTPHFALDGLCF